MMPKGKPSVKLGQCYLLGGYLVPELSRDEIQKSLKATHLKVSFEFALISEIGSMLFTRGVSGKVEKILKGSLDSIPSP